VHDVIRQFFRLFDASVHTERTRRGYAGSGKSAMLAVARETWEDSGYRVRGGCALGHCGREPRKRLRDRVAHHRQPGASLAQGRECLDAQDVLVIDEAGMIGSRQLERVLGEAERRGAKVVLVGDPEQLQAIEAGAAFRSLTERHSHVEIAEVRRQQIQETARSVKATEKQLKEGK
jgi:ATP-dependent exoDNAse (exonuclease V) alpha subunit